MSRLICGCVPWLEDHEGGDGFTSVFVRGAGYSGFLYGRMVEEHLFNFAWVDVETTGENQIFGAFYDIEETVLVHLTEVACVHPTVGKGRPSLILAVPVAFHDIGTFHHDLAYLASGERFAGDLVKDSRIDIGER